MTSTGVYIVIISIIPAKEDSSRLPNKNTQLINNMSLLEHAVVYSKTSNKIELIIVTTDSTLIAEQARNLGTTVIMRGKALCGETPLIDVYKDVLKKLTNNSITHVVGIQPDHPDRTANLDKAIQHALDNNIDDLFTLDARGNRNGALRILSARAFYNNNSIYPSAFIDNCTNIHSPYDYQIASANMSSTMQSINVEGKKIGVREPTFIIAEAACNHMCDMALAKKMINKAAEAGADAIKFQTYKAEKLVTKDATAFWGDETMSQLEYYHRLDRFGEEEYRELFSYAKEKGIIAFSSPFDEESNDMLERLNMPIYKIASCDICNIAHLRQISRYAKPIILSTGAATIDEIKNAIQTIFAEGNYQLILLACTLSYPTKPEDANIERITTLKKLFPKITIGLSDHTPPDKHMVIPAAAVALGAKIIEKHFTLDNCMTGSGHFFAVDPEALTNMVENIRMTEKILGNGKLGVAASEEKACFSARRSIVAEVAISKGQTISEKMLGLKRPADGLLGDRLHLVVGKQANQDILPDEQIHLSMLSETK